MRSRQSGLSLAEVMVTTAVVSLIAMSVHKSQTVIYKLGRNANYTQIMTHDAHHVLNTIAHDLKNCGDGLRGVTDPLTGQTVIATPADLLNNLMPEIIYLSKDEPAVGGGTGTLGPEDLWTRLSVGEQDGRAGLLIRVYQSDNWLDIKGGEAGLVQSRFLRLQEGVRIERLAFSLYDSQDPPRIANQDPSATSAVRIMLRLAKLDVTYEHEKTVTMESLLYGPM